MTISDFFPAAVGGGSRSGSPDIPKTEARAGSDPRARVADTDGDGNSLVASIRSDVVNAWPWRETPPSLRAVVADRVADKAKVPGGNPVLRAGWTVYNHTVAIPATATGYLLTWVAQHPARLALLFILGTPLLILLAA